MLRIGVSGQVRPNSGIGVIQRMVYPRLGKQFELVETETRDNHATAGLARVTGVLRGFVPISRRLDGYFCVVSPMPAWAPSPLVVVVHDLRWQRDPSRAKRIYRALDLRRVVTQATSIICVSDSTRADLERIYPSAARKTRTAKLGPGIIPDATVPQAGRQGSALLIGPAPHKRNVVAARVLAEMPRDIVSEVVCVNVSDDVEQIVRDAFGEEHSHFYGRVSDEKLVDLYLDAEFFVHLGVDEGFGLPYVEALRCGAQVVAIDTALTREVLGDAGVLLPDTELDAMVATFRAAPTVSEEQRRLVAAGYSWENFSGAVAESLRH